MEQVVVPVNYIAVLVAAIMQMVLGTLWYGPLFGKPWMEEMGFKKSSMDAAAKKGMAKSYGLMFVGALVMNFVLAHALVFAATYLRMEGVSAGLMSGFWNWLGFVAPVTLGPVLWEGKSWKLWGINNSYYLVALCLGGMLLSVWI